MNENIVTSSDEANEQWLDELLARPAMAIPDDEGFADQVMRRVAALAMPANAAASSQDVPPAAAIALLSSLLQSERRLEWWNSTGMLIGGAIAACVLWAHADPISALTVVALISLSWLALRRLRF